MKKKNLLHQKLTRIIWIKNLSIIYNLLIFSKKRLKYNFINFSSDLFFILLLPLLGYILDKKNFLYNNNSEFFFKKTLPGLNNFNIIISSNINWETFNYTEYFKKINWNKLKKISYFDNSIFICFNSSLYNKYFYIGTYINNNYFNSNKLLNKINENESNNKIFLFNKNRNNLKKNKILNKYFISGRFFNNFFKPSIYNKKNYLLLYKYNLNNLIFNNNNFKNNYFKKLKKWQTFFYELDYIPIKLDNIFYVNINNLNKINSMNSFNYETKKKYIIKNNNSVGPLFNNLFFYSNKTKFNFVTNYDIKEPIYLKKNFKTIIEKQNKRLNYEMFNKKISYNLWNFRFFQYKIYNKIFFFKFFLNNQINSFNYSKNNVLDNFIYFKFIKNKKEPNWKNLLRKDLKNLGSTKNENFFFNLDKSKTSSNTYFQDKYKIIDLLNLEKNKMKYPISLYNRENKNLINKLKNKDFIQNIDTQINVKNNKLYDFNINNKKYSFVPYVEKEFFYYLNYLIKINKLINLKKYSDKILFFVFKNYSFTNPLEKNIFNNFNETNNYLKKTLLLKQRIVEANSDLLKRKMSGYLYPDNTKNNLLFINKFNLFNNSFIKIQGQKNLIYKDFKKFYKNLFFLYNNNILIDYKIKQINYNNKNKDLDLKNKNHLKKTKFFFGNSVMDFGLSFNYDKNLKIINKKENYKIYYKPNLNLVYNKRRLDSKIPFSWEYPIKDELLLNNNYYYKSFFLFNKKNFDIIFFNKLSNKLSINKYNSLEINNYNEILLFPISYKSHFEYNKNYDFLNNYYSNFIKNFKNIFNADLYEVVTLKQFSLLIQLIFLLIFIKLINSLKENYGQSFLISFKTFFNNFEFDALTNLKIEVGKTFKLKQIKFNNLIGGKIFLQEFNQTILLLKNSQYGFQSNLNIKKPEFKFNSILINNKNFCLYSRNKKYKNVFFFINEKQKNFIYNFIYNPFYILFFIYNSKKLKKINNQFFIQNLKNTINIRGFLLVGPPGTGKTLLVKVLSGEANVPIILESGEKLSKLGIQNEQMSENAKGALKLKNLFNRAKKLSPCILFLDEIDNVGKNRKDVLTDYRKQHLRNYSTTNSLYFLSNNKINLDLVNSNKLNTNLINNNELNTKSLSMLTQLLCELDGLKNRQDLIIIGATNRPKTLDPALIRPGRLNKIIYIDLPGKKKRFELLKFYSKTKININKINWNFFTNQTIGFSAAHLSSSINIALLKTIYNLKKEKNFKFINKFKNTNLNNSFLIEDFKSIEYGIQTIKFKNISFKYKSYELSFLINNLILNYNYYNQLKILNLLNFSNYFIIFNININLLKNNNKNILTFYNKQLLNKKINKLTKLKKILRTIFYKKNKKFIRYLYLLNKKNNIKSFFIKKQKKYYILKNFYKYINRVFKVHVFSSFILMYSTYILNNPTIISFNFLYNYLKFKINTKYNFIKKNKFILTLNKNYIVFKYNNILKYKLIWYNFKLANNIYFNITNINKKYFYKKNIIFSKNITVLNYKNSNLSILSPFIDLFKIKKNKNYKINNKKKFFNEYYINIDKKKQNIQQLLLNDSIFINRMSYYLGGKTLILIILKKYIKNLNYLSLFSYKLENNQVQNNFFIQKIIKKLITKEEFENYLLFIITGKISEIKYLLNNNLINISNISINELKEIGWLLNNTINNNYFYKPIKYQLIKQTLIQEFKNPFKINNKKIIKNKTKTNKIKQKLIKLKNKFDKYFLLNKKYLINLNYKQFIFWDLIPYWWEPNLKIKNLNNIYWSFSKSKKVNLLTLLYRNSLKYNYYNNNYSNNKLKNNLFTSSINTKSLNLDNNFNTNKLFNIYLVNNLFELEINWNNFLLIEYYMLILNLIFNLTIKIFNLLEINIELLDYLSYYILCNEYVYNFKLNNIILKYYNIK